METGDYTTFINNSVWTKGDSQIGGNATTCSGKIISTALNREHAVAICNSITSKLPTNNTDGTANNKLLIGCGGVCTPSGNTDRFSIQVRLTDGLSTSGEWYCIGSSGAVYEGVYNSNAQGCFHNP